MPADGCLPIRVHAALSVPTMGSALGPPIKLRLDLEPLWVCQALALSKAAVVPLLPSSPLVLGTIASPRWLPGGGSNSQEPSPAPPSPLALQWRVQRGLSPSLPGTVRPPLAPAPSLLPWAGSAASWPPG